MCVVNVMASKTLFAGKNPVSAPLLVGVQVYTVVGVADLSEDSSAAPLGTVIVPIMAAPSMFSRGQLRQLLVQAPSPDQAILCATYLRNFYAQQFHSIDAVQVSSDAQLLQTIQTTHRTFTKLAVAVATMALLVEYQRGNCYGIRSDSPVAGDFAHSRAVFPHCRGLGVQHRDGTDIRPVSGYPFFRA